MGRPLTGQEFEELYRATVHDLIVYMRRRGSMDAENDVAEAYAIAWRRRTDLPTPMLRRAWLFGIAAKLLQADHRRKMQEDNAAAAFAQCPGLPTEAADDTIITTTMAAAMDRLAPADREILRLVEWELLTPAELAIVLGVRPGTARVRLHRARKALALDPAVRALVDGSEADEPEVSGAGSKSDPRIVPSHGPYPQACPDGPN